MLRLIFVLALLFAVFQPLAAQTAGDTLQKGVQADPKLKTLMAKHKEVVTKGKAKGYRVQIYFGSDKTKAKEIKTKFLSTYSGEAPAYEIYEVPNFKVRVGDFRTRLEAYRFLKKIKGDFPSSFIVACEIEMPSNK